MYAVTGASGNTGRVVAEKLLALGHKVRAIGRSPERLLPLAARGAEAFICDLTDQAALTTAFTDAEGVYAMIPPDMTSKNYRAHQDRITDSLAEALLRAKVERVVALSSVGADKVDKTGPVVGLHYLESKLNQISGLNVLHLRAGYFMENTLTQIGIIRTMGVMAGPLRSELEVPLIAGRDIGAVAAKSLIQRDFSGSQTRELLGQRDISMAEVAGIAGRAIGRPHLSYVRLPNPQVRESLIEMGVTENVADLVLEMSDAMNVGHMAALEERSAENTTPTSYEAFVKEEFAPRSLAKPATA